MGAGFTRVWFGQYLFSCKLRRWVRWVRCFHSRSPVSCSVQGWASRSTCSTDWSVSRPVVTEWIPGNGLDCTNQPHRAGSRGARVNLKGQRSATRPPTGRHTTQRSRPEGCWRPGRTKTCSSTPPPVTNGAVSEPSRMRLFSSPWALNLPTQHSAGLSGGQHTHQIPGRRGVETKEALG